MKIRASVCVLLYISTCVFFRNFLFCNCISMGMELGGCMGLGHLCMSQKPKTCQTKAKQGSCSGFRCVWTKSVVLRTCLRVRGEI